MSDNYILDPKDGIGPKGGKPRIGQEFYAAVLNDCNLFDRPKACLAISFAKGEKESPINLARFFRLRFGIAFWRSNPDTKAVNPLLSKCFCYNYIKTSKKNLDFLDGQEQVIQMFDLEPLHSIREADFREPKLLLKSDYLLRFSGPDSVSLCNEIHKIMWNLKKDEISFCTLDFQEQQVDAISRLTCHNIASLNSFVCDYMNGVYVETICDKQKLDETIIDLAQNRIKALNKADVLLSADIAGQCRAQCDFIPPKETEVSKNCSLFECQTELHY